MASDNFVIGRDCKVGEIILLLKSSPSFPMFHDKFAEFALELDTGRAMVKKLKDDYRLDKISLVDVVHNLIEEWVCRTATKATIQELVRALNEIGSTGCSELLVIKLTAKGNKGADVKIKKYDRVPTSIQEFLLGTSKFCIVHTLDCEITCEKLCDNWENCILHDWKGFVRLTSSPRNCDTKTVDIVKNCTISNLRHLSKVKEEAHMKVVFVTTEGEQSVKEVVGKSASWKDEVVICVDNMDWEDLTWAFQVELIDKLENLYEIEFEEVELSGKVLVNLINGKVLKLFKDTLSKELSYYVDRRVLTRCFLSSDIFGKTCADVFLFTGMERYELTSRAKNFVTDASSNQIRQPKLTVRYMILDQPSHFGKIFSKACAPVHLLHFENGKLRWIKSRGGMGKIQDFVDKSQVELTEEDFCKLVSANTTEAVCISDSPGMGKSVLLAQIGRRLEQSYPERLVLFVVISELINQVKETGMEDKVSAAELALKSIVCDNVVGEVVLSSKLGQEQTENEVGVELLLDGFDEVGSVDEKFAYEILHTIRESFKSVRMWITSRPHLLHGLEDHLSILGYNIQPFNEEDQMHFLTSFWSRNSPEDVGVPGIYQFAQSCLNSLKNKMNSKDQDIAGIPLQCLLIGEVYEDDALEYSRSVVASETSCPMHIDIGTITNLYRQLIERKLAKYRNLYGDENFDHRAIMEMHVRISLELIFPEQFPILQHMLRQTELDEVLKVGIVTSTDKTNLGRVKFIHRTFAEYLVAWFVTDRVMSGVSWDDCLTHFLMEDVLRAGSSPTGLRKYGYISSLINVVPHNQRFERFSYQVTSYFIDSLMGDFVFQKLPTDVIQSIQKTSSQSEVAMKIIVHGCILEDYVNILTFFNEIKAFGHHASTIFCDEVLIIAIGYSGLRLVKTVLGHFPEPDTMPFHTQVWILQALVSRGEYSTLEYFVKEKGFRKLVEHPKERTGAALVLHDCVTVTNRDSESEISQRIHIMNMLVGINSQLLEVEDTNGLTPLLAFDVHIRLRIELIRLGANVFGKNPEYWYSILHKLPFISVTNHSYNSILRNIAEDDLRKLVRVETRDMESPLMLAVRTMDPLPETFDIFLEVGADFNSVNNSHESILAVAIRIGRTVDTLRNLISNGASIYWQTCNGGTLLHLGAKYGNVDAVKLFIREYGMNANPKSKRGYTPMDCLIKSHDNTGRRFDAGLFLKENGGQFNDSANPVDQSLLHMAAREGNAQSMRLLIHLKSNVNAVDSHGNTPLHVAIGLPTIQLLLESNANPKAVNKFGETPFHTALKNTYSNFRALQLLQSQMDWKWTEQLAHLWLLAILKEYLPMADDKFNSFARECAADGVRLDWNYLNSNGETLLHLVANQCNFSKAKFSIEDVAVTEFHKFKSTRDPIGLHHRTMNGLGEIITFLIEKGVDVFAIDNQNYTFVHILIQNIGYCQNFLIEELLEYLVENNHCSVFEVKGGVNENTPLQLAIQWGILTERRMLKLLHKRGVNLNILDKDGRNVLSYAILGKQEPETVSTLIDCGTDYRIVDNNRCNLLHTSAQAGNIHSLKVLLGLGEWDVNAVNSDGNTPLHCAVQKVMYVKEMCRMLVEKGADTNIKNKDGETPLSLALTKWWHTNDFELHRILEGQSDSQVGDSEAVHSTISSSSVNSDDTDGDDPTGYEA